MNAWGPAMLVAALGCGCGNTPVHIQSRALAHQASPASVAPAMSERYIIAAVDNESGLGVARAGSTPRGYDAISPYGPTTRAGRLMRSVEDEYGLREISAWPIQPLRMHCAVLEVPVGADPAALLAALSHDERIKLAQPLHSFATRTQRYNDPYVDLQRGFQRMDVADAHPWSRGEGVRVAIIDTGVDTEHPDLRGAIFAAENFVDSDDQQFRRDRHGTEIAGVIAAVANNSRGIVGVAPAAKVMVFKACWQSQFDSDAARCNSFTLARALVAAFDAHVQVVNLSIAGPDDPLLRSLIEAGVRRGILFVGAAPAEAESGNSSFLQQAGVIEVAAEETALPVAAALYAPGREILTLMPGGHYDFASGASIATAQVTGVVALMLARNPGLTATSAYRLLRDTSTHPVDLGNGTDRVDACAAVVAVVGRGACARFDANGSRLADEPGARGRRH